MKLNKILIGLITGLILCLSQCSDPYEEAEDDYEDLYLYSLLLSAAASSTSTVCEVQSGCTSSYPFSCDNSSFCYSTESGCQNSSSCSLTESLQSSNKMLTEESLDPENLPEGVIVKETPEN